MATRRNPIRPPSSATLALLLTTLMANLPSLLGAVDGTIDPTFGGGDGRTVYSGSDVAIDSIPAKVLEAPDGATVVVGYFPSGGIYWSLVADSGEVESCHLDLPRGPSAAQAHDAAFDLSGRLVVAGRAAFGIAGTQGILVRYLYPACALDVTFNTDGLFRTDEPETVSLVAVDVDATGKLVAGGLSGNDPYLLRLTNGGLYDFGFSGDGHLLLPLGTTSLLTDLAVQPDGRIVVAGAATTATMGTHWALARLNADGNAIDIVFGDLGVQRIDWNVAFADVPQRLVIDPVGGEIVIAGQLGGGSFSQKLAGVARLESDGDLDLTFSVDGVWAGALGESASLFDLALQSDGKILAAGWVGFADDQEYLVVRLGADGAPDPTYDDDGLAVIPFDNGAGDDDFARAIGLSAGRAVVAGSVETPGHDSGLIGVTRLTSALIFADGLERGTTSGWSISVP